MNWDGGGVNLKFLSVTCVLLVAWQHIEVTHERFKVRKKNFQVVDSRGVSQRT